MAEESKKEEKKEAPEVQKPAEAAQPKPEDSKTETPKAEAAPAAPEVAKPAEAKKEETAPKKEKPANCAGCNKSIKKKRWYYRNGKYYCSHRCWKSTLKKETKPEESQAAPK